MGELTRLPNIGKVLEKQLNEVDIYTISDLKNTGAKKAWLNMSLHDSSACYNRLLALAAACKNVKKDDLDDRTILDIRAFYKEIKNY